MIESYPEKRRILHRTASVGIVAVYRVVHMLGLDRGVAWCFGLALRRGDGDAPLELAELFLLGLSHKSLLVKGTPSNGGRNAGRQQHEHNEHDNC